MESKSEKEQTMMKKTRLKEFLKTASGFMKVFLMFFIMWVGFFFIYSLIWFNTGLLNGWTVLFPAALAALTEYGYYRWIAV